MMDCKKALEEANNDFDGAIEIIRKRGQAIAAKREDREAAEGCARVAFFAPDDPNRLSSLMQSAIEGNFRDFAPVCRIPIQEPYAKNYQELFDILLE